MDAVKPPYEEESPSLHLRQKHVLAEPWRSEEAEAAPPVIICKRSMIVRKATKAMKARKATKAVVIKLNALRK